MKLSDQFTEKALTFASKVSSQKHMCAIKNAFTSLMPVIITGSFCTLPMLSAPPREMVSV